MCIRDRVGRDDIIICQANIVNVHHRLQGYFVVEKRILNMDCLLYTSDAADERSSVDLGGRRIIKKNTTIKISNSSHSLQQNM